jgi:hypothetical protein
LYQDKKSTIQIPQNAELIKKNNKNTMFISEKVGNIPKNSYHPSLKMIGKNWREKNPRYGREKKWRKTGKGTLA